jgi:hypothetical protein
MKRFYNKSIDYISDEEALLKLKNIDTKIMDLNDISGYVKGVEGFKSKFKEGYQNINKKDIFEYQLEKNRSATKYIQYLWCVNLIGLGAFLYFINNS